VAQEQDVFYKGDLVPGPGTYRCLGCGELWTATESKIRFPPCDADKSGETRWVRAMDQAQQPRTM
jgi:hypothetical protein